MDSGLVLRDGDRIGILGGGPAGSFFALFALRLAHLLGRYISVTIYDRKDFAHVGPQGCNMCAGAIGSSLVDHLKEIGVPLPPQVVRQEVEGYSFHGAGKVVFLRPAPGERIFTVFRGGGPPGQHYGAEITSFDQHLLGFAESLGAKVVHQRIEGVELPLGEGERPIIKFTGGEEKADLVVGAFGVNSMLTRKLSFGYRPPETWHTCQTELEVDRTFVEARLKNMIHIFSTVKSGLHFLAITPKGNHLTVTGIGRHVHIRDLKQEMKGPLVREYLPEHWESLCHCHPQVPVGYARRPYAGRLVIIGDAGFSRYLKNGIESAFITAGLAAQTALNKGIASADFHENYYLPCLRTFARDNYMGRLLFSFHRMVSLNDVLFRICLEVVQSEQRNEEDQVKRLSTILWHMFTGDAPYRQIFFQGLSPSLAWEFLRSSFSLAWQTGWTRNLN